MGSATSGLVADSVLGHSPSPASLMPSARIQGGLLNQPPTAPSSLSPPSVRGISPPGVRGLKPPRGMASSGGAVMGSRRWKKNLLHRRRCKERDDSDDRGEGGESGEGEAGKLTEGKGSPIAGLVYLTTSVSGSEAGLMGDSPAHEALGRAILESIPMSNHGADDATAAGILMSDHRADLASARPNPAEGLDGDAGLKGVAAANGVAQLDAAAGFNGVAVSCIAAGSNGAAELNGAAKLYAAAGSSGAAAQNGAAQNGAAQNGAASWPVDAAALTPREPNHTLNGFPHVREKLSYCKLCG